MIDERDDVLRDLRIELAAVTPSPSFAASVRARVADTPARRRWLSWSALPVAVAAATMIVTAIPISRMPVWELPIAAPARPAVPVAASMPSAATVIESPNAVAVTRPAAQGGPAIPLRPSGPAPLAAVVIDPFEVQVPRDQAVALRSLLVALRERRAVVPAPTAAWSLEPLPELEALIIPPLQLELLPGTPAAGGGRKTP
jgi:hypothetical protein